MSGIDLKNYELKKAKTTPVAGRQQGSWLDFLNKDIKLPGSGLNDKKKERFYSELNILLGAGVDIKTALELIVEQQSRQSDKALFTAIKEQVINGGSLSEAVATTNKFSPYEYYSLQIGEESGKISEVLKDLTHFFSRKIAQKRQAINALSYPAIVLFTALGAIFFMMYFVVPMFANVFKRFNTDLPYLTKVVLRASDFFIHYALYFFLFLFLSGLLVYMQRKKEWFRKHSSSLMMRIPVMGEMIKKIYLARFCQSMNLLLASRTPLITAIDLVKKMIGFYPIQKSLDAIQQDILKGTSLYESMARYPVYNARMLSLIKVAEEVNQLDLIFSKLAGQFSDEVDHQTGLISSLIEPVMIIFLGLLVAVILVAMYLPMFQLSTSFH